MIVQAPIITYGNTITQDYSSVNNLKRDDAPKYWSHMQQI